MRISDIPSGVTTTPARRNARSSGTRFDALLDVEETPAPPTSAAPASITMAGALMALQQVEDATTGRSRGLKRAEAMLDDLNEMHRALLLGGIPAARLQMMAKSLQERQSDHGDPRLDNILADIELRVAVELAKRGMAPAFVLQRLPA